MLYFKTPVLFSNANSQFLPTVNLSLCLPSPLPQWANAKEEEDSGCHSECASGITWHRYSDNALRTAKGNVFTEGPVPLA